MNLTTEIAAKLDHLIINDVYDVFAKSNCFVDLIFVQNKSRPLALQAISFVLNRAGTMLTSRMTPEVAMPINHISEITPHFMTSEILDFQNKVLACKNELRMSAHNLAVFIYERVSHRDVATQTNLLTVIFSPPVVPYEIYVNEQVSGAVEITDDEGARLFAMMAFYINDMIEDLEASNVINTRTPEALYQLLMKHPDENIRAKLLHASLTYLASTLIRKIRDEVYDEMRREQFEPIRDLPPSNREPN